MWRLHCWLKCAAHVHCDDWPFVFFCHAIAETLWKPVCWVIGNFKSWGELVRNSWFNRGAFIQVPPKKLQKRSTLLAGVAPCRTQPLGMSLVHPRWCPRKCCGPVGRRVGPDTRSSFMSLRGLQQASTSSYTAHREPPKCIEREGGGKVDTEEQRREVWGLQSCWSALTGSLL